HFLQRRINVVLHTALKYLLIPEIIPGAFWKINIAGNCSLLQHRANQNLIAKSKFILSVVVYNVILLQHDQWTQNWKSVAVMFPKHRIQVWKQLIPQFDKLPVDAGIRLAKAPGLSFYGV